MKRPLQILILSFSICLLAFSATAERNSNSLHLTEDAIALNVTINVGDATCAGASNGVVTAVPDGGLPPYTYLWNTGATTQTVSGLPIGTYMVTVTDDLGATATETAVVGESTPLNVVLAATYETSAGCSDGKVDVVKSELGDTGPYTYQWSTGSTHYQLLDLPAGIYCVTVTNAFGCTGSGCAEVEVLPGGLTLTTTSTNVFCNGANEGTATVIAASGIPPYTYQWDDPLMQTTSSAVNLPAGTYNVTVTGATNSCPAIASVTITEPAPIDIQVSTVDETCTLGNGSIALNVSGGTSGYTYAWSDPAFGNTATINNLTAGTYSVTVTDANGCTAITNPNPITIIDDCVNPPTCTNPVVTSVVVFEGTCGNSDGQATVNVAGGPGGYSFVWTPNVSTTNSATGLPTGTYTVVITDLTDATCTTTETFTLGVIDGPVVQILSTTPATCKETNGTAVLGPIGLTYEWCNGYVGNNPTNLPAGECQVTVTDPNTGCVDVIEVVIEEFIPLNATPNITQQPDCGANNGAVSITVGGGSFNYSYAWSDGGTGADRNDLAPGAYCVTVTDNGPTGCVVTTCFVLTASTGNVAVDAISPVAVTCAGSSDGTVQYTVVPDDPNNTVVITDAANVIQTNGSLIPGNYCITVFDNTGCAVGGDCFEVISPSQIDVDVDVLDKDCIAGGTIDLVDVSGGNGGFTFAWSGPGAFTANTQSVNNLEEGSYSVTITDVNGCAVIVDGIAIEDICNCAPPVVTSVVVIEAHCGFTDGKATVYVAGNIADYNFIWTPNISFDNKIQGVGPGIYSVRIVDKTDPTCVSEETFTVGATGGFDDVQINAVNASCNLADGTVNLTPATYEYLWSDSFMGASRSDLSAGTYFIQISDPATPGGCIDFITVEVGEDNPLQIQAVINQYPDCNTANGEVTLEVTGGSNNYSYSWGSGTNTQGNLAGGVYAVTVTDMATGCQKEITFGLSENVPSASLNIDPVVNTSCTGLDDATVDLINLNTAPGFVGPAVIRILDASNNEFQSGNLPPGNYCAVIRDANNCIAGTTCFEIVYPKQIDIDIAVENKNCIQEGSIELVEVIGGTGDFNFDWLDINPSTDDPKDRLDLDAGTYTVIASDANGCAITEEININADVYSLTGTFVVGQVSCDANMDGTITITPGGGTGPYTYQWSPNPADSSFIDSLGTGQYSVTITDIAGCTTSLDSIMVTADNSLAILSSDVVNIPCEGGNDGAIDVVPTGGTGPYDYSWSSMLPNSGSQSGLPAGQYAVTITDANGCTVVGGPYEVSALNSLNIQLTQDTVACGDSVKLTVVVVSSANATIIWKDELGTILEMDTTMIKVPIADTMTYTVEVSVGGCMSTASVTVEEFIFDPMVTPMLSACMGVELQLNADGDTTSFIYEWSPGGGLDDPTKPDPVILNPEQRGIYTVTITDPSMPGCPVIRTVDLTVNDLPTIDILGDRIACTLTEPNEFTATSTNPASNYEWSTNDQFTPSVSGANYNGLPILPGDSVTYYVRVVDPTTMCENMDSVELKNQTIQVELGEPMDVCADDKVNVEPIISLSTGEVLEFIWSVENATIDNAIPEEPVVAPSETTFVVAEISNNFGCSMEDSLLLRVQDVNPDILAVADPDTIRLGESSQLNVVGDDGYEYAWFPEETLSDSNIPDPVASPTETTLYNVEIKTEIGCAIERTVEVVVVTPCVESLFFPNAFTPNGDDNNDVLFLRGSFVKEAHFVIYNRWGEKVFESNNVDNGWDGTYKGKQLSSDVFGYYLRVTCLDDEEYYEQGNVSLLR